MAKVTYCLRVPAALRAAIAAEVDRRNRNPLKGGITATDWWIDAAVEKLAKTGRSNRGRAKAPAKEPEEEER